MTPQVQATETETDANYVEVLTTERDGTPYGYRLVGASAGPQVVVLGSCAAAELAFDRLMSIPTLPWMRGNLVLIHLDALDDDLSQIEDLGPVERTLKLPFASQVVPSDTQVRHSYHTVLRLCADLGMITGRGVPGTPVGSDAA